MDPSEGSEGTGKRSAIEKNGQTQCRAVFLFTLINHLISYYTCFKEGIKSYLAVVLALLIG